VKTVSFVYGEKKSPEFLQQKNNGNTDGNTKISKEVIPKVILTVILISVVSL